MQELFGEVIMFKRFLKDDRGATAIEYTLIAGAMAVFVVAGWPILTDALNSDATTIATKLTSFK